VCADRVAVVFVRFPQRPLFCWVWGGYLCLRDLGRILTPQGSGDSCGGSVVVSPIPAPSRGETTTAFSSGFLSVAGTRMRSWATLGSGPGGSSQEFSPSPTLRRPTPHPGGRGSRSRDARPSGRDPDFAHLEADALRHPHPGWTSPRPLEAGLPMRRPTQRPPR
jgi:hypothetical protein